MFFEVISGISTGNLVQVSLVVQIAWNVAWAFALFYVFILNSGEMSNFGNKTVHLKKNVGGAKHQK